MKKLIAALLSTFVLSTSTACDMTNASPVVEVSSHDNTYTQSIVTDNSAIFNINDIPSYKSSAYVTINGNKPFFKDTEIEFKSYEIYADFDEYDRCGVAVACLSTDTMPAEDEERGAIGSVKPAGWHTVKYPEVISDLYLYNRCHLIGWQLGAENANEYNLITGTRYLNVDGMLPFENQVADYIRDTNNHVMYRVTPVYIDDELLCRGVLMEAQSVEDDDCVFCVYCYNVQPGVEIDYKTGNSWLTGETSTETSVTTDSSSMMYILNTKSMKIHYPDCEHADKISDYNRSEYNGDIDILFDKGYTSCGSCKP